MERESSNSSTSYTPFQWSLERFQSFFNSGDYGLWEWDLASGVLYYQGGFWQRLDYGYQGELPAKGVGGLLEFVHADDKARGREVIEDQLKTKDIQDVTYRFQAADGSYHWTQARVDSICDDDGQLIRLLGVNIDITQLKETESALLESEARHARILHASSDGIWEWSAEDGGFTFSDRCWEQIGFDSQDDLVLEGRDRLKLWRSLLHPDDLPRFDLMLKHHLSGRGAFDIEYRVMSKSGDIRWIHARGSASFDECGRPLKMSGTNMDVTDLKRAEGRVLLARESAEKANKAKSEFLSNMSHELRTPLNSILGFAQLFDYDDNLNQDQRENVKDIVSAGQHLLRLINDVLDLSKVESGTMDVSLEAVRPAPMVEECLTLIHSLAQSKGITLFTNWNDLADDYIYADHMRLKQVLLNLISNAVKYNREGGEVEVFFERGEGHYFRIAVRDTGIGIPQEKQKDMFQPFNRLGAESSQIEGSGIGLLITQRLLNMMEGKLNFHSRENEGSTFFIELPRVDESYVVAQKEEFSVSEPTALNVSGRYSVLYVEDNPTNVRVMKQFFARFSNLSLLITQDAYMGLHRARAEQPDLIIMDINLPGMDGFEALKALREESKTSAIPVAALSANVMADNIERGKQAGFCEYLTKPLNFNHLVQVLNRELGGRE